MSVAKTCARKQPRSSRPAGAAGEPLRGWARGFPDPALRPSSRDLRVTSLVLSRTKHITFSGTSGRVRSLREEFSPGVPLSRRVVRPACERAPRSSRRLPLTPNSIHVHRLSRNLWESSACVCHPDLARGRSLATGATLPQIMPSRAAAASEHGSPVCAVEQLHIPPSPVYSGERGRG